MYSVLLDENDYFTGSYTEIGSIVGGVEVFTLPSDMAKATCYKLYNNDWIYDKDKWEQIQTDTMLVNIRKQRNVVFSLIDKYQLTLVYESLTLEQKTELAAYRQAWLDVPETKVIPEKPEWVV